jgi:thiamine biosynthesis lipoprotein
MLPVAQEPAAGFSRRDALTLRIAPAESSEYWIRIHRPAMACRFEVTLSGEDARHVDAARQTLDTIDRIEDALTVFRDTSELVRVNRGAGAEAVRVGDELFRLLVLCRDLHRQTEGAFDVTSTPLSRCWGFMKREGRLPAEDEIARARAGVGMEGVELHEGTVRFRRPGMELNLGAVGKGWALDRVGAALRGRGVRHALLSAGGSSILALGGRAGGWVVDLRSPQVRRGRLLRLRLSDAALGASGAGRQYVDVAGKRYGHVLDPRTGWPAGGVISAAVIASDAAVADALSTAFLVGGLELAERYCATHEGVLAVVTPEDGSERPRVFGAHSGAAAEPV